MTDSIARIKARAATRARMDLKGTSAARTGKTRRKINCKPPNVKCGGRCIPPSWDCRLEGKGTNSELKSHQYDPLGGVASVERGIKTIAKNPTDPQNLDRGRNAIIRGIVKATPGDNLEQKKKLKRNLQKYGNQIGAVMLLGAGAIGAHQTAKRLNSSYARGLGRSIDMAAFGAVDAVLDRTPIVGGQRAAARAGGLSVARQLGRGLAIEANNETALARSLTNSGRIGGLGVATVRGNFQNTNVLQGQQSLQRLVRGVDTNGKPIAGAKMTFDTWRGRAASALYGAKVQGKNSAYSDDAANRLISGQFGLRVNNAFQAAGQTARTQASRNEEVRSALATRLRGFGDTMRADMEIRRYERDKKGKFTAAAIRSYVDTQVIPSMGLSRGGLSSAQQNNARRKARSLAIDILSNGTEKSYRDQAGTMRAAVVGQYNNYFAEASNRMSLPGASKQSTFGDGQVGLARYVMKQNAGASGRVVPVKSRSHADLILKDHFTRKVQGTPNGTFTASTSTVQRVAQQLNGGRSVPDVASAYSIVQESGIKSLRAPGEAPSTGRRTKAKAPAKSSKGGLGGQRSQSDLARKIMQRPSFKGTYAEALAQARREMKRSDAAEVRDDAKKSQGTGKSCGESHIPKSYECRKTQNGPASTRENAGLSKNQKIAAAAGLTLTAGLGIALIAKGKLKPPNSSFKTKLQSRTVAEYVSDSKAINQGLRTGRSELFEDEITVIDDWIKGSQATKGTFFRGINDKKVLDYLSKAKVGDSYTDLGYGSFSKDKEIADEFSRPDQKGNTYMLRVQRASLYRIPVEQFPFRREVDEKEHLAPRNARFRITGKKPLATYPDGSQSLLIDLVYLGNK